jgi:hypothetical protein
MKELKKLIATTGPQVSMNLWYSALGLYQPKQQKYHTTVPE